MEKKYYPIDEVLANLSYRGLTISDFGKYVSEKLIHPIVYLDDVETCAYEASDTGENELVIGYCRISAYWDIGPQIIEVVDQIINSTFVSTSSAVIEGLIKEESLIEKPEISAWLYNKDRFPRYFRKVPPELLNLKPFSNDLKIKHFETTPSHSSFPSFKQIKLSDILITRKDFDTLKELMIKRRTPSRASKTHSLRKLITKIRKECSDKSARSVWNKLITLCEAGHSILQDIDPWTEPNARIYWKTHKGREDKMGRKRFENIISELNK